MSGSYKRRPHDDIVEPMFGALAEEEASESPSERSTEPQPVHSHSLGGHEETGGGVSAALLFGLIGLGLLILIAVLVVVRTVAANVL